MIRFDWSTAAVTLEGFGGERRDLYVEKTGLPFYDVLRLYGMIDLFVGLKDNICIYDTGSRWRVSAQIRAHVASDTLLRLLKVAGLLNNDNLSTVQKACISELILATDGGE